MNEKYKIIKERFDECMNNTSSCLNEANPLRDKKGHFSGPEDAVVYSFTNAALKSGAVKDKSKIKRGKYNKSSGKTTSPFGMNTSKTKSCGRKRMDGSNISSPSHSCSKYPAKYQENLEDTEDPAAPLLKIRIRSKMTPSSGKQIDEGNYNEPSKPPNFKLIDVMAALKVLIDQNPDELHFINQQFNKLGYAHRSQLTKACRDAGFFDRNEWVQWTNQQALAAKGELNRSPKK